MDEKILYYPKKHTARWRYCAAEAYTSIKSNTLKTFLSINLIWSEKFFFYFRVILYSSLQERPTNDLLLYRTAFKSLSPAHVLSCFEVVCTVAMATLFPPLITWLTAWLEEGCGGLRRDRGVNVCSYVTFNKMC